MVRVLWVVNRARVLVSAYVTELHLLKLILLPFVYYYALPSVTVPACILRRLAPPKNVCACLVYDLLQSILRILGILLIYDYHSSISREPQWFITSALL